MFDFNKSHSETATAPADLGQRAAGLLAGTKVATSAGWRDVAHLQKGDCVLTFDAGLQEVTRVVRHRLIAGNAAHDPAQWPLLVPAGALGNLSDTIVLPGQPVLIESDVAEAMFGDPFAAVRGRDLDGINGIACVAPDDAVEVVTIHFAQDQVVFVAGGLMALCQGTGCLLAWNDDAQGAAPLYRILEQQDADAVLLYDVAPAGSAAPVTARAA